MERRIKAVVLALLFVVFAYSVIRVLIYYVEYRKQDELYKTATGNYIEEVPAAGETAEKKEGREEAADICPVIVDFTSLLAENEDVVGWLYCEDTNINYPVVQGTDNDHYLHHAYNGEYSRAGSIFADTVNRSDFSDSNTIIYGHHMKNGSMFAHLADWADQRYFEAHPVMWLLTPEQTYRVDLFAGFLTSADSDAYTIFTGACPEFGDYLAGVLAASDVQVNVETPRDEHYIMLSTCEYEFQDARYVLYGILIPV